MIKVLGKEFKSVKKAAEYYGVNRGTVHTRMKKQGMTLEEALTTPLREKIEVEVEGNNFNSLYEACKVYQANYSTVYCRVKYEGMLPEEAILY